MKNISLVVIAAVLAVMAFILFAGHQYPVHAQPSYGALSFGPIAPTLSSCPAGETNKTSFCTVGTVSTSYAIYVSYNGGAYQPLIPPAPTTVSCKTWPVKTVFNASSCQIK